MLGIGCFGIVKLGCGWCCGDFHEKNWVGLGVGVSNCKKNWVGVVVGGCGQLKLGLGLGLGVAVHGLIGLGLWLGVPKPYFAHPWVGHLKGLTHSSAYKHYMLDHKLINRKNRT